MSTKVMKGDTPLINRLKQIKNPERPFAGAFKKIERIGTLRGVNLFGQAINSEQTHS